MRVDSGVRAGSVIAEIYDPMVAKLIVWDVDRESARRRMMRALDEYVVEGPATLIPFHRWLLENEEFIAGGACHALLAELAERATPIPPPRGPARSRRRPPTPPRRPHRRPSAASRPRWTGAASRWRCATTSRPAAARPPGGGAHARRPSEPRGAGGGGGAPDQVVTPMQGTVLKVLVEVGQEIAAGDVVCIVEAMKMENEVAAHQAGTVRELRAAVGQGVVAGEILAIVS